MYSLNLLFCNDSLCLPYGLHIEGRMNCFIRDIFFMSSSKTRTIFSWPTTGDCCCCCCWRLDGWTNVGGVCGWCRDGGRCGGCDWSRLFKLFVDGVSRDDKFWTFEVCAQAPLCNANRSLLVGESRREISAVALELLKSVALCTGVCGKSSAACAAVINWGDLDGKWAADERSNARASACNIDASNCFLSNCWRTRCFSIDDILPNFSRFCWAMARFCCWRMAAVSWCCWAAAAAAAAAAADDDPYFICLSVIAVDRGCCALAFEWLWFWCNCDWNCFSAGLASICVISIMADGTELAADAAAAAAAATAAVVDDDDDDDDGADKFCCMRAADCWCCCCAFCNCCIKSTLPWPLNADWKAASMKLALFPMCVL